MVFFLPAVVRIIEGSDNWCSTV